VPPPYGSGGPGAEPPEVLDETASQDGALSDECDHVEDAMPAEADGSGEDGGASSEVSSGTGGNREDDFDAHPPDEDEDEQW